MSRLNGVGRCRRGSRSNVRRWPWFHFGLGEARTRVRRTIRPSWRVLGALIPGSNRCYDLSGADSPLRMSRSSRSRLGEGTPGVEGPRMSMRTDTTLRVLAGKAWVLCDVIGEHDKMPVMIEGLVLCCPFGKSSENMQFLQGSKRECSSRTRHRSARLPAPSFVDFIRLPNRSSRRHVTNRFLRADLSRHHPLRATQPRSLGMHQLGRTSEPRNEPTRTHLALTHRRKPPRIRRDDGRDERRMRAIPLHRSRSWDRSHCLQLLQGKKSESGQARPQRDDRKLHEHCFGHPSPSRSPHKKKRSNNPNHYVTEQRIYFRTHSY
jgi:hypothetical protein